MAVTFDIQFRISVATKVIRLTDTSTGFTYGKGCFKVEFPNGVVRNLPDFSTPDISTAGNPIDIPCEVDASGNVVTGTYIISYAVINNLSAGQNPLVRTFNFNWIEPANGITNFSDVITPEVVFKDLTSYSPIGSFTGALTRTITASFPSTSEVSGSSPVTSTSTNTVTVVSGANYYEGVYTPTSAVSVAYTHTSNAWLTILYTRTFSKTFDIRKCPNQLELVQKINAYRVIIDAYKGTNDTQFNLLSEQYDLVIALYSHLIAMHQTTTQDGSEPILRELLSILEPYSGTYSPQPTKMLTFSLAVSGANSFNISDGTNTDAVPLGSTLTFASGNAALVPIVTNNNITYSPTFGTLINTFAQGNDSRFHNPVTIGTANGLSISTQALSLAAATSGSAGAMSASDKTKLDGIASGATANTGTVTSVALTVPAAFSVSGSPITTAGTLAITAGGTSAEYITGAGALVTLNTANVPENTNLYFTTSRARTSISLTTTGTTGAATYDNTTGVLNIPSYIGGVTSFNTRTGAIVLSSADVTTALTYTPVPTNRNLTINGVSFDLSADRSWTIAAGVTSFNTRTGAITPTAGDYTTALVTEVTNLYYTDARARAAISLTTTGTSGSATYDNATGVLNIPAYQGGVTSFNTRTGAITLTSGDVTTALTYTPYNATNPSAYIALTSLSFAAGSGAYNNTTGVITIPTNNTHLTNGAGYITGITSGNVTAALGFTPENAANKGIANGYASLDGGGLVPSTQLPSYVDDVLEFANLAALPATGETGKIYVALDTNKIYRWSGATYIEVSPTVGTIWGSITGTLANQTDLQSALNLKAPLASPTFTGTVILPTGTVASADLNWTYYTDEVDLPSATTKHGMFAHVHNTGAAYYAHAGSWYKLAKQTDLDLKAPLASPTFTGTVSGITKSMVGLGSVDNTTDANKPVSTATQTALNLKYDATNPNNYIALTALSFVAGSGAYNNTTGVITIPTNNTHLTNGSNYITLASLSFVAGSGGYNSTTGVITIPTNNSQLTNGSNYITLTGLSSTATGLTYTNTTGVFSLTAGYEIPTTASIATWDTAYTNRITSLTVTGSSGAATLVSNVLNIPTYTLTGLGGVPTARTITINGTAQELSANRSFTISTNPSARAEENFVATAAQTTFTITGGYVVGLVDVYVNGVRYLPTDYTATNGTTVVLGIGLLAGDAVTILNYTSSIAALPTSRNVQDFTATAAQTTFTVTNGYIVGLIDVFVNGSKLTSSEFTATNGTTFVLTVASTVGDQVQSINYTASVNGISGAGTANYVPKFTASGTIGNSNLINDASGNLGLSVTPSAWTAGGQNIEVGSACNIIQGQASQIAIIQNATFNTGWKYSATGFASFVLQTTGQHQWFTAPSGTAGTAITFTQAMTLNASGQLGIGTTSPNTLLTTNQTGTTGYFYSGQQSGTEIAYWYYNANEVQFSSKAAARALTFLTTDTERMRIDSAGNLGLGVVPFTNTLGKSFDLSG